MPTPNHNPKTLSQKLSDYHQVSFASWLEKTNLVATEEGDLNNLVSDIKSRLIALANDLDDPKQINLVNAINESFGESRRVLIKAIAMS